jgi:probable addiction module antidote protein
MAKRKGKVTVSRYDSADYLKTEEDMAAYLEACLEEAPDDASYLAAALGTIARARGMVQLSARYGYQPRRSVQSTIEGRQSDL